MRRRRHPVSESDRERWMVSYADFITLLFAFFVVMYSISKVNENQYRVLSNTLTEVFGSTDNLFEELDRPIPEEQTAPGNPDALVNFAEKQGSPSEVANDNDMGGVASGDLKVIGSLVAEGFSQLINDGLASVTGNQLWLEVTLNSQILFGSGAVSLIPEAELVIKELGAIMAAFRNPIHVEGYTDDIPIKTERFASNWELSAARAAAVVQLLIEGGVGPERLAAVGYGEFQPVASNATPAGRNANRRIVVVVSRDVNVRRTLSGLGGSVAGQVLGELENALVEQDQTLNEEDLDAPMYAELPGQESEQEEVSEEAPEQEETVVTRRTSSGGLLFTNSQDQEAEE